MKEKSNACGIVGLCTGWLIPVAGIVLGVIALSRNERTKALGILSIVSGMTFWIFWTMLFL